MREAVLAFSTDDTTLIRCLTTRSKRFLARVSLDYRSSYNVSLHEMIDSQLDGWYAYLAKFLVVQVRFLCGGGGGSGGTEVARRRWWQRHGAHLATSVVQEAQADSLLLDLALDGEGTDQAALIEFLCARHPRRVRAAKKKW